MLIIGKLITCMWLAHVMSTPLISMIWSPGRKRPSWAIRPSGKTSWTTTHLWKTNESKLLIWLSYMYIELSKNINIIPTILQHISGFRNCRINGAFTAFYWWNHYKIWLNFQGLNPVVFNSDKKLALRALI